MASIQLVSSMDATREEVIWVGSNQQLLLSTTVDINGKTIVFKRKACYTGLKDQLSISFPPFCVLGEEKNHLDIISENIINDYNASEGKNAKNVVTTPVLHVERVNGAPFLRTVEVKLPLVSDAKNWLDRGVENHPCRMDYSATESKVSVRTQKFSFIGAHFCKITKVLDAIGFNDDFNKKYTKYGICLIIEQNNNDSNNAENTKFKFNFDLRKFKDCEEHQRYRMDETKTFCLLLNPQKVEKGLQEESKSSNRRFAYILFTSLFFASHFIIISQELKRCRLNKRISTKKKNKWS